MQYCPKCGKELSDNMQFCPGCGTSVNTASIGKQLASNKPIENLAASTPYTTVQYTPGYEQSMEQPKKKVNKLIIVLIIIAIGAIGATVGAIKYFTGDTYKYKKALEILKVGDYEAAFNLFYNLGNYEDSESYLPFHGKYICVSISDDRYLKFTDGKYEEMIPGSEEDSYYYGTYITDGFDSAVITEDDGDVETYKVYKNYIYDEESEDFVFDETVDIASGYFNGNITEEMSVDNLSSGAIDLKWLYSFEDDGTYNYRVEFYYDGTILESSTYNETGTYEIDGDFINLTSNDDGDTVSFLVIDGYVYRSVYVRNY